MLLKNTGVKILCLILSFSFWYVYHGEETVSKTIQFYISPRINQNMFLVNVNSAAISVTIKGGRKDIKQIKEIAHSIELDLTNEMDAKIVQKEITQNYFSFGSSIWITKIEPSKVEIELDKLVNKTIKIEAVTKGQIAPNYTLAGIKLTPNRLKIWGPEKFLKKLDILKTESIDVSGLSANFVQDVIILPPFESFNQKPTIKATISINKSKQEKVFENIPVRIMLKSTDMLQKCMIKTSAVSLKVEASIIDFQGINGEDFLAFINISDLKDGSYQLPVSIVKKDAFKIKNIFPKSVEVAIGDRV